MPRKTVMAAPVNLSRLLAGLKGLQTGSTEPPSSGREDKERRYFFPGFTVMMYLVLMVPPKSSNVPPNSMTCFPTLRGARSK